jgi:hypothetical protein
VLHRGGAAVDCRAGNVWRVTTEQDRWNAVMVAIAPGCINRTPPSGRSLRVAVIVRCRYRRGASVLVDDLLAGYRDLRC